MNREVKSVDLKILFCAFIFPPFVSIFNPKESTNNFYEKQLPIGTEAQEMIRSEIGFDSGNG